MRDGAGHTSTHASTHHCALIGLAQMLKRLVSVNVNALGSDKKKEMHFIELAQAVREADKFRLKTDTANKVCICVSRVCVCVCLLKCECIGEHGGREGRR